MTDLVGRDRFGSTGAHDLADPLIAWLSHFLARVEVPFPEPEPEQEGLWQSGGVFSQSLVDVYRDVDLTLMLVARASGLISRDRGAVRVRLFPKTGRRVGATMPIYRGVTATRPKVDLLSGVAPHRVTIPNPAEVLGYLGRCAELAALLPAICEETRREFGPGVELSLEVYKDPEVEDRYLTLYVRQHPYDADIMGRIEAVNQKFNPTLETIPGYFLVTTDFRRPKGKHAV